MLTVIFIIICYFLALVVFPLLALTGALALLSWMVGWLRRRGVTAWLLAPFRAWTGLDGARRPRP